MVRNLTCLMSTEGPYLTPHLNTVLDIEGGAKTVISKVIEASNMVITIEIGIFSRRLSFMGIDQRMPLPRCDVSLLAHSLDLAPREDHQGNCRHRS